MKSCHLQFLRYASTAPILNEMTALGAAHACRQLSQWASDPTLVDSVAAPVVTEAVKLFSGILEKAESQQADRFSECTLRDMRLSLSALRNFLVDEEPNDTTTSSDMSDLGSSVKERCRDTHKDQDHRAASLKASLHMWIMVFVLFTVIVGGTAAMCVMGSSELQAYVEQRRHDRAFTLLGIAIDALDALYPFLQQAGVDVQVSGVTVAAAVLEEMSSAQGRAALQQSIFFSPKNSLFEYRAGKQNFAQQNRVTAMRTRRTYALLCRQNITNPIGPTSRYGPSASVVFPAVSPGLCGNDAGRRGVFGGIMPPYQTYTPHVTTYRRNSARVSNYYHKGFGTSIAATQDYEHLSQLMSPEEVSFQFSTVWGHGRYAWCSGAFRWIALVVGCSLCLVVGTMDLLPFFHDKLGRACISLGIALIVTVTLVAVEVTINHSITHAAYNVQLNGARITGRCLAGAVTSATMNQYGAAESFLDLVGSQSLKSRVFFVDNNPVDGIAVRPQDMMSAAEAIGWKTFNVERLVGSVAIIGGYCFASFFDITREKFAVYIEPEDYQRHISGGVWVSVSAGAASFVFVFAYIRISPLNRLAAAGKGSPLLQVYVDPQYLRFVLYIVILVVVVATMVAINVFGVTLINSATTFQSAQTLQLIGATNRALSVVDNCIGSCGLPSTMTTQVFKLVNGAVNLVYSYVPYPVPVGDWESHYYGAQLALSKLPTVLEGMLSFSTPLVNRTSGYIDPRYLQHRMLASVDVNDTSGFVMERLPSSTLSPTYAFVSHSIGMSLALGGVCISVCVLGWLYFRMGRLQRARRSLRGNYVLMALVVLLVSSMVLVNAAIMKYEMYRALEDFAKQELSLAVRAGNSRLEKISITSISEVGVQEDTVEKLVIAANNMSDTVQAGLTFLGRWRILEETSLSSNVNVVNVLGGGLNGVQATLPSLDIGVNPVCTLDLSSKLSVTSDTPKLACYSQLVNGNGTANVHRLYVLVWRDVDDLYSSAAGNAWQQLMLMSGLAFVLILMITMVWLWWVMHSVHSSRYYLFTHQSGDSETPTIRRQSVSRLNRIRWIGLTSVLLLTDISYVVLSLSKLSSDLQVAERVSVPYLLQDDQSKLMEYEAVSEGYNYLMYPSEPMTTDLIKQTAEDVKADRARYVVVLPDERAALELELQTMVSELLSASDVASYVEEPLVSAGYDSTTSWVANEYQYYVEGQKKIQQLMGSLASTFSLFLSVDNSALHTQQVPLLLHAWTQVLSLFSQLFILDHLAVASYLDLSRTLSANSNWRFGSIETANAMTVQVMEARDYLVDRIEIELAQFYDFVGTIMENSEMINIMKSTVTDIHLNYPAACAVNNPSATIWQAQAMRCQEDVFSGNATAYAIVRKQRSVKVKKLGRMDRAFSLIFSADLSYRKGVQLREAIDSGADVSRMQALLAWERQAQVSNARYKMVVGSFCAVPLMVVVGMCMAIIYGFLRSSTKMNQTDTEVTPLHPPTEATTRSNDSSKFIIRTTDRPVVRPLFLCVLITAIPLSCGFWLGHELVNSSQDAVDSSEVAALYGIQRQKTLVRGVGRFWKLSGQGSVSSNLELYKEAAASLEMDMTAFITVYSSLLHITGTNATSTFRALVSNMKNVMDSINTESSYLASATDLVHMVSVAEPLSVYARQVIAGMSPADNYALLTPLGSANPGPVYDLMEDLFNKVVTDISSPTADTSAIFAKYMSEILVVDEVAQAYLNMWHVAVTAAAKGGESIAATYWNFESLVGTDALTPLSSSGVGSAGAAVTAITTFFAPLLAVSTTKDAVETLFTTTDAPTNETGPVSAYLNAAYVSTYLGSINTSATFANVYAYNRGLTPTTFTLSGQTPLVSYLDSVVSQSAHLMTVGLSTADYVYTMQPATMNRWIWSVEVIGEYHPALPSEEFNYRFVAIEWCSVTAAWVVLLYVVYFVFFVLSDP